MCRQTLPRMIRTAKNNWPGGQGNGEKMKKNSRNLLETLLEEMQRQVSGGIYYKLQVEMTYNSNHMEGSRLSHEQTRYIFETNTIGVAEQTVNVDDILEAVNHFRCIDQVIAGAEQPLAEAFIKELHATLKSGTSDSRKDWFSVGEYKQLPNEVGGGPTTLPENVADEMAQLLSSYNASAKSLEDIIDFHVRFEKIHPFQDGNGRVGRLIMLKECLNNDIVPFIIADEYKSFYYRGLQEWEHERGYLLDTCLIAQDNFKQWLDYFRISY